MKMRLLLGILLSGILLSCNNKEPELVSSIERTRLLGTWEIQKRSTNGIVSQSVDCCEYLKFSDNDELNDNIGIFISYSEFHNIEGSFEIDTAKAEILFRFNNKELTYNYKIETNMLTFTYMEEENEIIEDWIRK